MCTLRQSWVYVGFLWIQAASVADLALTLWGLKLGVIEEANPLLAPLLADNPLLAAALKLGLTGVGVLVLLRIYPSSTRLVSFGVGLVGISLLVVLVMHMIWIATLY